jgi:hypothetical protein
MKRTRRHFAWYRWWHHWWWHHGRMSYDCSSDLMWAARHKGHMMPILRYSTRYKGDGERVERL